MKKLILFSLLSVSCFAQNNCTELSVSNDDVTAKTTISSQTFDIGEFTLQVVAGTRKGSYPKLFFRIKSDDCIDPYRPIYLLFTDGKRLETANYVFEYNCGGDTGLIINSDSSKKLLTTNRIKTIRLDANTKFYQVEISEELSNKIQAAVMCAFDRKTWETQIKYKGGW